LADVRDADELHDVLHTLIALPEDCPSPVEREGSVARSHGANATDRWSRQFERLLLEGRAGVATIPYQIFFPDNPETRGATGFPREGRELPRALPECGFQSTLAEIAVAAPPTTMPCSWSSPAGCRTWPHPRIRTGRVLGLPAAEIEKALLRMEASGAVLRGKIHRPQSRRTEWCDRRLLARIPPPDGRHPAQADRARHRRAVHALAVALQHVAPGTQLGGERGALEVLRQLQGFEIPANAWERQILARRIADYDPKWSTNFASRAL